MTLVATLALDNHPLIIGDLLLSQEAHPADSPIPLPTGVDDFRGVRRTIAGLARKLVLIGPRCLLGWSCKNVETAEAVIANIRKLEADSTLTLETMYATINSHPRADEDRLSIIGWLVTGEIDGIVTVDEVDYEATYGESEIFSDIRAIGSGARPFFDLLRVLDKAQHSSGPPDEEEARRSLWLTRVFNLVGQLFAAEHRQGSFSKHLELSFGGGYELAIWDSGKFVFVDYTLSIWNAFVTSEGVKISVPPPLMASVFYQEEYLTIISERLLRQPDGSFNAQTYNFMIAPFAAQSVTFPPIAPPHFAHHIYAMHVRCEDTNSSSFGAMVEFSGPIEKPRARLDDLEEGKKVFVMMPDLQEEMVNNIRRMVEVP
jgi:hypothetical protein